MRKPYRCQSMSCSEDPAGRLIFDFWAEKPICPKCGVDAAKMPHVVIQLEVVHFDPPSKVFGRGQRIVACTRRGYGASNVIVTGNPTSVNCPECKATKEWRDIAEAWGLPDLTPEAAVEAEAVLEAGRDAASEIDVISMADAAAVA